MRSTIDKLPASLGLAPAALLLVGGLLTWASSFVGDQVATQLGQQDITMPTEQTGLANLRATAQGRTFSQVGEEATAACPKRGSADAPSAECTKLRATQNTLFQGNTLRGMVLNAYVGSAVMLLLGLLGFRHAKQVAGATAARP